MAAIPIPDVSEKPSENPQPPKPFSPVDESDYETLLGLAEFFRTSQPSRIRETIHCLQATLSIETLPAFEKARSRLNLAKLLLVHTKNIGHARAQLEQAVSGLSSFSLNLNLSICALSVLFWCLKSFTDNPNVQHLGRYKTLLAILL